MNKWNIPLSIKGMQCGLKIFNISVHLLLKERLLFAKNIENMDKK